MRLATKDNTKNMKKNVILFFLISLFCLPVLAQTAGDSVKISVRTSAGAEIGVDNEMSSTNIMSKWVKYGKHTVVVTCGSSYKKEYEIDVTPDGKTSFEYEIKGKFVPTVTPSKAEVLVDGIEYSGKEAVTALGVHNLYAYSNPKEYLPYENAFTVVPGDEEQSESYKMKKARIQLDGFIIGSYMLSSGTFNIMAGMGRRFGGYIKFSTTDGDSYIDDEPTNPSWGDRYTCDNKQEFWGLGVGVTYKPLYWLNIYAGGGNCRYTPGTYKPAESNHNHYSYDDIGLDNSPYYEFGAIAKYKAFLLQIGYTRALKTSDQGYHFGDFSIGLGINLHKNKKNKKKQK